MMTIRRSSALGPFGILSRLVVALALALFGVSPSQADRLAAQSGPAAESRIDAAHGIAPGQRHVLRALLPGDDTPDPVGPGEVVQLPCAPAFAGIAAAESAHLHVATIRILPPVRGPPAV